MVGETETAPPGEGWGRAGRVLRVWGSAHKLAPVSMDSGQGPRRAPYVVSPDFSFRMASIMAVNPLAASSGPQGSAK